MNRPADALRLVSPRELVERWAHFEPLISRALERSRAGQFPDDVLTCAQLGSMQVWDIRNGLSICVTEIQDYPRYRQLLIYLVAGEEAKDWIASGDRQLSEFAKSRNCKFIVFQARPGWERYARNFGYDDKLTLMRKEV